MPLEFVFAVTFLPPGSVIVTVEPASTLRTRTRIVFSWPARTRSPLGVDSVHGGCTTAAGLTATCGTAGAAAGGGSA